MSCSDTLSTTTDTKDLQQLEAEIKYYLNQTAQNIIEVGRRLSQAKSLIPYGQWQAWLRDNFQLDSRTARRFMQISRRFSKMVGVDHFQSSQLTEMLALPAETAKRFIAEKAAEGKPVADMSTRELRAEISQYKHREKPLPPISYCHNDTAEWYTPKIFVDAVRRVLGDIDLDPASSETANETIQAAKIYTAEDSGLNREWRGRIFLNPPYTRGLIEKFVDKFCAEFDGKNVTEAILLIDAATDTAYFRRLVERCNGICFSRGRINFCRGDGLTTRGHHVRGQAFLYYGSDMEKFFREFAQFGWCCTTKITTKKNPA